MSRRRNPFRPTLTTLEDRTVPYALSGYQWADTNVTASFMPDGTTTDDGSSSNLVAALNASFPTATWQREFARALQTWASVTPLNFRFVPDSGAASGTLGTGQSDGRFGDIRFGGYDLPGYVGYAYYPGNGSDTRSGDVFLDTAVTYRIGTSLDLYSVLLHETGHALGLAHSDAAAGTVMYSSITGVYSGLFADDVAGIQAIYGARRADAYDSGSGNNTLGSATAWSVGSTGAASLNADLTSVADVDYYKLVAPAAFDGTLRVSVIALNVSLLTPRVLVYDAAGNLLGSASATSYAGVATVNLTGLTPGQTYYLAADGATNDVFGMGAYRLSALFGEATVPPPPSPPTTPSVSIAGVSLSEGDAGTKQFNFTVALSAASTGTVTVQYGTADGTATAGSDYQSASGTLTFAPGETQKAVTVVVTGDTVVEGDETFRVDLSAPVNAVLGTGQGLGTIRNDDTAPVEIGPDRYESNDTAAIATNLGKVSSVNQGSLTLHTATDVDFYTFTAAKRGTYRVTLAPSQGSGMLNLAVFNAQQTVLTSGQFQNGSVTLTLSLNAGQQYYLKATSATGSQLAYSLTVAKAGKGRDGGGLTTGEEIGDGLEVRPSLWRSPPSAAAADPVPSSRSDGHAAPASNDAVQFLAAADEQGSEPAAAVRAPARETGSGSYTWQRGIDALAREDGLWDLAGLRSV